MILVDSTTISPLSDARIKNIKDTVKSLYGIEDEDNDADWIDRMLRNSYSALHDFNIMRNLVTVNIDKILLKHRDCMGSTKFENIQMNKLIFYYSTSASMSYRAGIPIASIVLCRTAIEAGLRERIAEKLAEEEVRDREQLPRRILEIMEGLEDKYKLWQLIEKAEEESIITEEQIEEYFRPLKFGKQEGRKILDKFIHGDITWIAEFVQSRCKGYWS
jgi:hypothetical protein